MPAAMETFDERKVFDTIPEQFDRWRLRYTPELFAALYADICATIK